MEFPLRAGHQRTWRWVIGALAVTATVFVGLPLVLVGATDGKGRDALLRGVIRAGDAGTVSSSRLALASGAFSVAAEAPLDRDGIDVLVARAVLGQWKPLLQAAHAIPKHQLSPQQRLSLAAWLCLLGDFDRGRDALSQGIPQTIPGPELSRSGIDATKLEIVRAGCGLRDPHGALAYNGPPHFFLGIQRLQEGSAQDTGSSQPRASNPHGLAPAPDFTFTQASTYGESRTEEQAGPETLPAVWSLATSSASPMDPRTALKFVYHRDQPIFLFDMPGPIDPWAALSPSVGSPLLYLEPDTLEGAAQRLRDAALRSRTRLDRVLPLGEPGRPCVSGGGQPIACPTRPSEVLAHSAAAIEIQAAFSWSRRGQTARGRLCLARAEQTFEKLLGLKLGIAHLLAGDAENAERVLRRTLEETAGNPSMNANQEWIVLSLNLAMALAELKRFDQAFEAIEATHRAATGVKWQIRTGWLKAALAIKTARPVTTPCYSETWATWRWTDTSVVPMTACLHRLSLATNEERRERRLRLPQVDLAPDAEEWDVLPALIYILGSLVPPEGDVEVWLDYILAPLHRSLDRRVPLARSVAARWRGDDESASRWASRAIALQQLTTDWHTLALSWTLGI